jgi:2'-5' RNA ligase
MNRIQIVSLDPTQESEEQFLSQVENFINRPKNQWKNISIHISLMLYCLPEDKVGDVIDILSTISSNFKPVTIKLGKINKFGIKYINIQIFDEKLNQMHLEVVEATKPIVRGYFNQKYLGDKLLPNQLKYLKEYGYHRIKEYFDPHITIGKYDGEDIRNMEFENVPNIVGELVFDKLTIFETPSDAPFPVKILLQKTL